MWLAVVVAMLILDQATKAYFSRLIVLGEAVEVSSWFNLVHVLNTGAAFSLLADADGWQQAFFITVGIFVVVPITILCLTRHASTYERWVGAAIVAGGSGNLIDRIRSGAVVDFLDLHWRGLHWPAFNLADVFVVSAVVLWLWFSLQKSLITRKETPS